MRYALYFIFVFLILTSTLIQGIDGFRFAKKFKDTDFNPVGQERRDIRSQLWWSGLMWILLAIIFLAKEILAWNCNPDLG